MEVESASNNKQEAFKIGFSFAKVAAPTKKKREPEPDHRDYVIGISGNQLTSLNPTYSSGPLVIPLEVQGQTKRSKTQVADASQTPENNKAASTVPSEQQQQQQPTTQSKTIDEIAAEALIKEATQAQPIEDTQPKPIPMILQNQIEGIENITDEEERFKYDLDSRPDEASPEAYDSVPIEEFGFAMLRGMGWCPGKPIGLNNRGLAEPIEFVPRPGFRLGLGATPKDIPVKKKKYIKPGESREPKPQMVLPVGPDGRVRHVRGLSEKLVPLKTGLQPGQLVGIVSGPHDGLYARVVNVEQDEVNVRLEASSEEVTVSKDDLYIVDTSKLAENHPALKFMMKQKKTEEESQEPANNKKDSKSRSRSKSDKSDKSPKDTWLYPHILVRVISKSFTNGKLYNKKAQVVDVVGAKECVVQLDNGTLVEGVKQRMLETVLPKPGGKVMVVEGPNRGKLGILLERKKSDDKEDAIVQLLSDLTIETYSLDDVAQYMGAGDEVMDMAA
jgi:G patch domain/KOW motif-containing protein